MNVPNLILEYLKALIWPAMVIYAAVRYRKSLDRLVERFCEETEEISSTGIRVKLAKVVHDISRVSEQLPAEQQQAKSALNDTRKELIRDLMRELAKDFFRLGLRGRRRTARTIYDLSTEADLNFILQLANSESPGERVASGICLEVQLNQHDALLQNNLVTQALKKGLGDSYSRVRYRYVHAIISRDELISRFHKELRKISMSDGNRSVQELAQGALDEI